jgi:hypothetical protein
VQQAAGSLTRRFTGHRPEPVPADR